MKIHKVKKNYIDLYHWMLFVSTYAIIMSYTVACEHPVFNKSVGSSLYVLNFLNELAVRVGTTVSFNCSEPGQVLVGLNTATCMENGEWVPDPSLLQMNCKGSDIRNKPYSGTSNINAVTLSGLRSQSLSFISKKKCQLSL